MKKIFVGLIAIMSLFIMVTFANYPPAIQEPSADEMLILVNVERAKVGSPPLKLDSRLNKSAQFKADDMHNNGYFDHVDRNGKQGYEYIWEYAPKACSYMAENIRLNSEANNSAETTIQAFVDSEAHYKAMVRPRYNLIGIGINKNIIVHHFCKSY